MRPLIVIALGIFILCVDLAAAETIYVRLDGGGDAVTIQDGIDAAVDGDTVLVAAGYYKGDGNRDIDFSGKAIVVKSESGAPATIIDCRGAFFDGLHRGFYFHSGEDTSSVLEGFTIYRGVSDRGGGICCIGSSPLIVKNIIVNNVAEIGGGIYCSESACVIRDNIIEHSNLIWENRFTTARPLTVDARTMKKYNEGYIGAGIYIINSSVKIIGNTINFNYAAFSGGGIYCYSSSAEIRDNHISRNLAFYANGGGIYCEQANAVISRNKIMSNQTDEGAGGIHSRESELLIERNEFTDNFGYYHGSAITSHGDRSITIRENFIHDNGSAWSAGGVELSSSPAVVTHNTIQGNYGHSGGGLNVNGDSSTSVTDNEICGNHGGRGGGIYCKGSPKIERNIIIGNTAWEWSGGGLYCEDSKSVIRYNVICRNRAMDYGAGIDCDDSSPLIAQNTIADNSSDYSGGGIYCRNGSCPDIRNCIVTGTHLTNAKTVVAGIVSHSPGSIPSVSCSDVFGNDGGNYVGMPDQTGLNGNISMDPLFCDAGDNEYSLDAISPCLPGNHPNARACGLIGALGIGCGGHVATLLRDHSFSVESGDAILRWELTAYEKPSNMRIYRSNSTELPFERLAEPDIVVRDLLYSYIERGLEPGETYRYRVYIEEDGREKMLFETDPVSVPKLQLTLFQNYPNPFNPSTAIRFYIPESSPVRVNVYTVAGTLIDCIVDEVKMRGFHTVEWDGTDKAGRPVATGIYMYRIINRKRTAAKKMVLVR